MHTAEADKAARDYTRLHEGRPPERVAMERVPRARGRRDVLGYIEQVQYLKLVTGGARAYWHPHDEDHQPELLRDQAGKLFFYGANYKVTDRGIEDLDTRVKENRRPKRLVVLGTLQWIRYRSPTGSQILRFEGAARPLLAHDELGKLHVLRGRYHVEVNPMARRRRHRRSHRAPMANPSGGGGSMKKTQRYVLAGLAVAAGGFVGMQVVQFIGSKLPPAWNMYVKTAAKVGGGLALGGLAYMYAPKQIAPTAATAMIVGSGIVGINDVWTQVRTRTAAGAFMLPSGQRRNTAFNPRLVAGARR